MYRFVNCTEIASYKFIIQHLVRGQHSALMCNALLGVYKPCRVGMMLQAAFKHHGDKWHSTFKHYAAIKRLDRGYLDIYHSWLNVIVCAVTPSSIWSVNNKLLRQKYVRLLSLYVYIEFLHVYVMHFDRSYLHVLNLY